MILLERAHNSYARIHKLLSRVGGSHYYKIFQAPIGNKYYFMGEVSRSFRSIKVLIVLEEMKSPLKKSSDNFGRNEKSF